MKNATLTKISYKNETDSMGDQIYFQRKTTITYNFVWKSELLR